MNTEIDDMKAEIRQLKAELAETKEQRVTHDTTSNADDVAEGVEQGLRNIRARNNKAAAFVVVPIFAIFLIALALAAIAAINSH